MPRILVCIRWLKQAWSNFCFFSRLKSSHWFALPVIEFRAYFYIFTTEIPFKYMLNLIKKLIPVHVILHLNCLIDLLCLLWKLMLIKLIRYWLLLLLLLLLSLYEILLRRIHSIITRWIVLASSHTLIFVLKLLLLLDVVHLHVLIKLMLHVLSGLVLLILLKLLMQIE